jgi:hypothetical protein
VLKSLATSAFWKLYDDLPEAAQGLADRAFATWQRDPRHPSLRFKPFKSNQWSARLGGHYRAVGRFVDGNTFLWTWIGSHEDYNKL